MPTCKKPTKNPFGLELSASVRLSRTEVGFSIQMAWKISPKTKRGPGELAITDLPFRILFFQGRPGILHSSSCMDIKRNSPIRISNKTFFIFNLVCKIPRFSNAQALQIFEGKVLLCILNSRKTFKCNYLSSDSFATSAKQKNLGSFN